MWFSWIATVLVTFIFVFLLLCLLDFIFGIKSDKENIRINILCTSAACVISGVSLILGLL